METLKLIVSLSLMGIGGYLVTTALLSIIKKTVESNVNRKIPKPYNQDRVKELESAIRNALNTPTLDGAENMLYDVLYRKKEKL